MESRRKTLYERCIACILMNYVCTSVDFVLNSIGLLWCNGSERQLRQGTTKKRDNWRPAEVGDGTRDTRAKNRDVPPKAGRVATLFYFQPFQRNSRECKILKWRRHVTLTTPTWGQFVITRFTRLILLPIIFEVPNFTPYGNMKCDANAENGVVWGG